MMMVLIMIGLFGVGILVGKEWTHIKTDREIITAKSEARFWMDVANRKRQMPTVPTWPPGSTKIPPDDEIEEPTIKYNRDFKDE